MEHIGKEDGQKRNYMGKNFYAGSLFAKVGYEYIATVAENTRFERSHVSAATCILLTYSSAVKFNFQRIVASLKGINYP